ncbi:hypothetical protein D3C72_366530 [compost metagenome]
MTLANSICIKSKLLSQNCLVQHVLEFLLGSQCLPGYGIRNVHHQAEQGKLHFV